jgi:hypothetical protein
LNLTVNLNPYLFRHDHQHKTWVGFAEPPLWQQDNRLKTQRWARPPPAGGPKGRRPGGGG